MAHWLSSRRGGITVRHDVAVPNKIAIKIREYTYIYPVQTCLGVYLRVFHIPVFLGRWFSFRETLINSACEYTDRSAHLGKYRLSNNCRSLIYKNSSRSSREYGNRVFYPFRFRASTRPDMPIPVNAGVVGSGMVAFPDATGLNGTQLKHSSSPWPPPGRSNAVTKGTTVNTPPALASGVFTTGLYFIPGSKFHLNNIVKTWTLWKPPAENYFKVIVTIP